ncbi:MAG: type IV pili methyl-accepting chemotaxis transducer N-terminal domain-containing protein [Porticoccus sp.]|nr:type IV pili methyl-accepting chemotaxis transducer N-terminal domain-containing protein [Porticoccus sp.]
MTKMIAGQKLRFSQSIAIQVLIPMVVIGLLALASMLVSLLVTLNTQHDAEAINIAGSMRMQSYRIAVLLKQQTSSISARETMAEALTKEHRLFSQKLYKSSISKTAEKFNHGAIKHRYTDVVNSWENIIVPVFLPIMSPHNLSSEQINLASEHYLTLVDEHVNKIDTLVLSIQQNTEEKIELLGIYEGLSIFLSFLALIFIVMRADQNLVKPLKDLVRAAEHTSVGDFSYRTYYEGVNEIGLLCSIFNDMTSSLARHYQKLEDLVNDKTAQLQQSNQVLDFLYNTAQRLSEGATDRKALTNIVTDLKKLTNIPQLSLCLTSETSVDEYHLILPTDDQHPCQLSDCISCFTRPQKEHSIQGEFSFSIEDGNENFGFLYVKTGENLPMEPWQQRLIEAVVEHLSFAMALQYREGLSRRLMLFEERSIIARELHDSLAQSLSYMKMQVALISKLFERNASENKVREGLEDLQQGMNAAYKHLRELLTTFRLKLDAPTLYLALKATVDEFNKIRDDIEIVLDYGLGHCPLSANEDIHVLQIIREAMTNAIKHSQASRIELRCEQGENHRAIFSVTDNGIGIPKNPYKEHHYGLSTMQERAKLVDGKLDIQSIDDKGTTVSLTFTPEALR